MFSIDLSLAFVQLLFNLGAEWAIRYGATSKRRQRVTTEKEMILRQEQVILKEKRNSSILNEK
jgi:hypothetical protein